MYAQSIFGTPIVHGLQPRHSVQTMDGLTWQTAVDYGLVKLVCERFGWTGLAEDCG